MSGITIQRRPTLPYPHIPEIAAALGIASAQARAANARAAREETARLAAEASADLLRARVAELEIAAGLNRLARTVTGRSADDLAAYLDDETVVIELDPFASVQRLYDVGGRRG